MATGGDDNTTTGAGKRALPPGRGCPLKLATRQEFSVGDGDGDEHTLTVEQPPELAGGYAQIESSIWS